MATVWSGTVIARKSETYEHSWEVVKETDTPIAIFFGEGAEATAEYLAGFLNEGNSLTDFYEWVSAHTA